MALFKMWTDVEILHETSLEQFFSRNLNFKKTGKVCHLQVMHGTILNDETLIVTS